jgi:DinB family protein
MPNDQNKPLREQLLHAMRGDQSHIDFESVVSDFPTKLAGAKPASAPHTAWQLLEHMRIAQHDILEFSRNSKHTSPKWPEGYWPKTEAPPDEQAWSDSIATFRQEAKAMEDLLLDPNQDLFKSIEGGSGQTLLREALVLAAHNSYHLGQLMYLKKMLLA